MKNSKVKKANTIKRIKADRRVIDKPEDIKMQEEIRSRADYSLAVWGMAFVKNGSGRYLNLRADSMAEA